MRRVKEAALTMDPPYPLMEEYDFRKVTPPTHPRRSGQPAAGFSLSFSDSLTHPPTHPPTHPIPTGQHQQTSANHAQKHHQRSVLPPTHPPTHPPATHSTSYQPPALPLPTHPPTQSQQPASHSKAKETHYSPTHPPTPSPYLPTKIPTHDVRKRPGPLGHYRPTLWGGEDSDGGHRSKYHTKRGTSLLPPTHPPTHPPTLVLYPVGRLKL